MAHSNPVVTRVVTSVGYQEGALVTAGVCSVILARHFELR
jgi:hypothetical protein